MAASVNYYPSSPAKKQKSRTLWPNKGICVVEFDPLAIKSKGFFIN